MAKRVEGTLEKVIDSAKAEFLTLGFEKASMRNIAKTAGVTTGALYVRFPNKDSLFGALVQPVINELFAMFSESANMGMEYLRSGKVEEAYSQSGEYLAFLLDYVYNSIDVFRLLLNCAAGSSYENFFETVVAWQVKYATEYLEQKHLADGAIPELAQDELHLLISAQYYAVFEVVRHDIQRDEAVRLINTIARFFNPGWHQFFG